MNPGVDASKRSRSRHSIVADPGDEQVDRDQGELDQVDHGRGELDQGDHEQEEQEQEEA